MKEILFRGKRLDNGEWVTGGSIIQFLDDGIRYFYMPQFNEKCVCEHDAISDNIQSFTNCEFYKINSETVGQYIGLKDKNGNMIFEGDIVDMSECWWDSAGPAGHNSPIEMVKWDNRYCGFTPFADYDCDCGVYIYAEDVKIIGNIFDNPELLHSE